MRCIRPRRARRHFPVDVSRNCLAPKQPTLAANAALHASSLPDAFARTFCASTLVALRLSLLWLQLLTWYTLWLSERVKSRKPSDATSLSWDCWSAVTAGLLPQPPSSKRNLLGWLLLWDLRAFASCIAAGSIVVVTLAARQVAEQEVDGSLWPVAGATITLLRDTHRFWPSWRMKVTLFLFRTTFQLTALPFFLFWLPGLDWFFTRASPTGYSQQGECVKKDGGGLSGYVNELEWQLSRSHTQRELKEEQRLHIQAELASARAWLASKSWAVHARACTVLEASLMRNRLESTVCAFVPPSHVLWRPLFPLRDRCRAYERTLAASGEMHPALLLDHERCQAKAERFGIDYQAKSTCSECRLCSKKFFLGGVLVRRPRHHCRVCGFISCDACSRRSRVIKRTDGTKGSERVCDVCDAVWHLIGRNPSTADPSTSEQLSSGAEGLV